MKVEREKVLQFFFFFIPCMARKKYEYFHLDNFFVMKFQVKSVKHIVLPMYMSGVRNPISREYIFQNFNLTSVKLNRKNFQISKVNMCTIFPGM